MTTEADAVCDLVTTACDLVERHRRPGVVDRPAAADLALLREELCAVAALCSEDALAGDLDAVVCELDALLARARRLPEPLAALTG